MYFSSTLTTMAGKLNTNWTMNNIVRLYSQPTTTIKKLNHGLFKFKNPTFPWNRIAWSLLLASSASFIIYVCSLAFSQSIRRMGMISDANTTYFFLHLLPKYMGRICVFVGFLCLTTFGDWISMFSFVYFFFFLIFGSFIFIFSCEEMHSLKVEGWNRIGEGGLSWEFFTLLTVEIWVPTK